MELFVLAMMANTYIPVIKLIIPYMVAMAKAGLTLTLFLIGADLTRRVIMSIGCMPLIQGLVLWIFITAAASYAVMHLA